MIIKFEVNRKQIELDVPPKKRLLDILREDLELIGTKEGCGKGECGACTILMDGKRVNSCLVPAFQLDGSKIVTIEGLEDWKAFSELERIYTESGAVQCGFCTSGFVMSTAAFLKETESPVSTEQIKTALGGNICRCTGYTKIIHAVKEITNQPDIVQTVLEDWENVFDRSE